MKVWRYWSVTVHGGAEGVRLNSDIADGLEFRASFDFSTPLRVLTRHGDRHHDLWACPPQLTESQWTSGWRRKPKTLREMGVAMDERDLGWQTFEMAIRSGDDLAYLRFLIAIRSIVESDTEIHARRRLLRKEIELPVWAKFNGLPGHHVDQICDFFFPSFLSTVSSLPHHAAVAMWEVALDTPERIAQASDDQLLAFKGIGPAVLRSLRARCAEIAEGRNQPLLDMVRR